MPQWWTPPLKGYIVVDGYYMSIPQVQKKKQEDTVHLSDATRKLLLEGGKICGFIGDEGDEHVLSWLSKIPSTTSLSTH
jgi:hypothetical protein